MCESVLGKLGNMPITIDVPMAMIIFVGDWWRHGLPLLVNTICS